MPPQPTTEFTPTLSFSYIAKKEVSYLFTPGYDSIGYPKLFRALASYYDVRT